MLLCWWPCDLLVGLTDSTDFLFLYAAYVELISCQAYAYIWSHKLPSWHNLMSSLETCLHNWDLCEENVKRSFSHDQNAGAKLDY